MLAGGDAVLGLSKDRRPQPCGSLQRSCCHAWTQDTKFYAPAQDRVPLFLAGLNPPLLAEVPASKSERDANAASQRVVFPCLCWCLLCCFSAGVRPLPPAQSLGQFDRPHLSEGTSQTSDYRVLCALLPSCPCCSHSKKGSEDLSTNI